LTKAVNDILGDKCLMYASDFPHPEGARNPIERFESGSAA